MRDRNTHSEDEQHRPFAVLIASRPPAEAGRARSGFVSLALHVLLGSGLVWATMAVAQESDDEADEPVYVELVEEVEIPPPPPPPPPPEMRPPVEDVFRGYQTLEVPTVTPPVIPPPTSTEEFRAADFSGEGVLGGRAEGLEPPSGLDPNTPTFTPMTVRPSLKNQDEITRALAREYPPMLREAGIGGTVVVWLFLDTEGRVVNTRVHTSSGQDSLDEAALAVASLMEFTPAYNRDQKVAVWVSVPVTFQVR